MKSNLKILIAACRLALGGVAFAVKKRTPHRAYMAMIHLFCMTGGVSNDLLSRWLSAFRPRYRLPGTEGVLGPLEAEKLKAIGDELREKGFHVFDRKLPEDLCDRLVQFAYSQQCTVRKTDQALHDGKAAVVTVYDPHNPQGIAYDFDPEVLANHPDIQGLLADLSLIAVAQEYLGSQPIADVLTMWWLTAFSGQPDESAALLYHFDMDRIKWIKFFFYLSDVTDNNGPHSFVPGSHRTGGIPDALLSKGYVRLQDEEIAAHYSAEHMLEITAPRGTILAEDTRGLHKGKPIHAGDRLMLQIQFSNSLFGTNYRKVRIHSIHTPRLTQLRDQFRRIYASFSF